MKAFTSAVFRKATTSIANVAQAVAAAALPSRFACRFGGIHQAGFQLLQSLKNQFSRDRAGGDPPHEPPPTPTPHPLKARPQVPVRFGEIVDGESVTAHSAYGTTPSCNVRYATRILESRRPRRDQPRPERTGALVWVRRTPKPTKVFDSYFAFAAERQRMFYRQLINKHPPTTDPILEAFRFTNVFRASDRVSQFLINEVIPGSAGTAPDTFFRVVLFKLFNRISTWRLIEDALGPVHWPGFDITACDSLLASIRASGAAIYSAAYIMPDPSLGGASKHANHLQLLRMMMDDRLPERVAGAHTMGDVYRLLLGYRSIGRFLAYQLTIDLNYTSLTDFSEMDFVVAGPGAIDGLTKCFQDYGGLNSADLIRFTATVAEEYSERVGFELPSLWGRRPQLIDFQNLFCEVDKYARAKHPDFLGRSGRSRIKQRYRPDMTPMRRGYPAKWRLPLADATVDRIAVSFPGDCGGVAASPQ
jgi:5-hmdU DNA kinase-like protein